MNAQAMCDELLKYVEIGERIFQKLTIQNWISSYTRAFKHKATEHELEIELVKSPQNISQIA